MVSMGVCQKMSLGLSSDLLDITQFLLELITDCFRAVASLFASPPKHRRCRCFFQIGCACRGSWCSDLTGSPGRTPFLLRRLLLPDFAQTSGAAEASVPACPTAT